MTDEAIPQYSLRSIKLRLVWVISALALLGLSSPIQAEGRRAETSSLALMSFNVEFMWDGVEPEEGSSSIEFPWRGDPVLAGEKMEQIAAIIKANDPDIVNLVEVENIEALRHLNETYLADQGYVAYLKNGRDTYTGQDVGLLTRIDPDEPLWREDRKGSSGEVEKSASKNYTAKFTIDGEKIALISVHFLSRPTDELRLHDRQAQADSILTRAIELDQKCYHVIIAGNINDYDGSREASDHVNKKPITNVVARLRGMDASDPDDDLVNVAQFVPKRAAMETKMPARRAGRATTPIHKRLDDLSFVTGAHHFF